MYKFKIEKKKELTSKYKLSDMADMIGLNLSTISRIINGKQACKKVVALCITKLLDQNKEINEYFKQI